MSILMKDAGKSSAGTCKKYYAVVKETVIDKDGKPTYGYTRAIIEDTDLLVSARDNRVDDLIKKVDEIYDLLANGAKPEAKEEPAAVAAEPVAEPIAEPTPEPTPEPVVLAAPAEEEVAAAEAVAEAEPAKLVIKSRCFAEKMRDADEVLQDRYDELKNYALRYRKLKARISKKFDSVNQGRFQFVKLSVAGKTLKLYLNMDINTTEPKFHCKDVSDKKTYVTVPVLLRIKSGRAVKYAKRLIDQCAEQHGMLERRKPFEVDAMALIDEALAEKEAN